MSTVSLSKTQHATDFLELEEFAVPYIQPETLPLKVAAQNNFKKTAHFNYPTTLKKNQETSKSLNNIKNTALSSRKQKSGLFQWSSSDLNCKGITERDLMGRFSQRRNQAQTTFSDTCVVPFKAIVPYSSQNKKPQSGFDTSSALFSAPQASSAPEARSALHRASRHRVLKSASAEWSCHDSSSDSDALSTPRALDDGSGSLKQRRRDGWQHPRRSYNFHIGLMLTLEARRSRLKEGRQERRGPLL